MEARSSCIPADEVILEVGLVEPVGRAIDKGAQLHAVQARVDDCLDWHPSVDEDDAAEAVHMQPVLERHTG